MSSPIYVAIDTPDLAQATKLARAVKRHAGGLKLGLEFFAANGPEGVSEIAHLGLPLFLDLKLHDIGNTVTKGVESVAQLGATFLTVHAYPQTMKAAVEGRRGSKLRILAVTVLTSYDDADLAAAGYEMSVGELAAARAAQARDTGVDGLVCSAEEAASLRDIAGPGMVLVTPGIRPTGSSTGDQKRIMTPARAIEAGANYLVVGRPVLEAPEPRVIADAIVAEIEQTAKSQGVR